MSGQLTAQTYSFHFSIEKRIGNSPSVSLNPVRNNFVKPNKHENEPSARCMDSLRIIVRQMIMNEGMWLWKQPSCIHFTEVKAKTVVRG